MDNTEQPSKFTTGLIIDYFSEPDNKLFSIISEAKQQGRIDEALAIVLPIADASFSWEQRVEIAEKNSRTDGVKVFDVWHQAPTDINDNEAYVASVMSDLQSQYSHQLQIIIHSVLAQ